MLSISFMPSPKDDPALLPIWEKLRDEYRETYRRGALMQLAREYDVSYSTVRYWLGSAKILTRSVEDSRRFGRQYSKFERKAQQTISLLFADNELLSMDDLTEEIQEKHGIKPKPQTVLKYINQINQNSDFHIDEDASHPGSYRMHKKESQE